MAMVVQHNITAMNSNRQLGVTTGSQAKSSEKLSSGYRINRAGDDAAGLKISEKMRSQVRGLNRASTNAQDGVSLIQTAEGALNEAHSILQRMNELAVQGANDTNEGIDRDAINQELDQLTQELDRISTTTQFNKQNLLDGTFQNKNLQVGANENQKIQITIDNMNAETLGLRSIKGEEQGKTQTGQRPTEITYKGNTYTYNVDHTPDQNKANAISVFKAAISRAANEDQYAMKTASDGTVYYTGSKTTSGGPATSEINIAARTSTVGLMSTNAAGSAVSALSGAVQKKSTVNISGRTSTVNKMTTSTVNIAAKMSTTNLTSTNAAGSVVPALSGGAQKTSAVSVAARTSTKNVPIQEEAGFVRYATAASAMKDDIAIAKSAMVAEMSANYADHLKLENVVADDVTVAASATPFTMTKPAVDTYAKANATITAVQDAINRVSTQRSALGALQNRLEHTIANLDNVSENTAAAESRIRDTDMASEMVEYSKNNILAQAGQSMLAQANQSNQGVLSLLQ